MKGILYYSSISGNTRLVGEALQELFRRADLPLVLQNVAEDTTWHDDVDFALFGAGTYAHGMIEKSLRKCVEELWKEKRVRMPCAAIGLGDHRYDVEYNMYAADQLELWLNEHGGRIIVPALKINRSPIKEVNTKKIQEWAKNFIVTLRK